MSVMLATLCLNEMEFLPRLWEQHKGWPDVSAFVFVEASDAAYERANPGMVSATGLSVDGTSDFLRDLARRDSRVVHAPIGRCSNPDPALGKIDARNWYWREAARVEPSFIISLDADEMYVKADQPRINEQMRFWAKRGYTGFTFPKREIWRPPSIAAEPLFAKEVVGGFWGIPCCHWWAWSRGAGHFACHNTPQDASGRYLNDSLKQLHGDPDMPQMLHLGFAATAKTRRAKQLYYEGRGESDDPQRRWYVDSRRCWNDWKPGDPLPNKARVIEYTGPIPEVFRES